MALPISPGEIYAVAKFAYDLWKSCKAFEDDFEQIGKEVFAMRTVLELVQIEYQDPESIINLVDNKENTVRKQLRVYIGNCEQALKAVDRLLKRYKAMKLWERIAWSLSGHAEVSSLESNLSSFATQLDSYVQKLELKGLALVNRNVGLGNQRIASRIGRLEDLLEQHNGDEKAAVAEMMQERQKCGGSQSDRTRSRTVMTDYVKEMCYGSSKKQRPKTPDPPRGRPKGDGNTLAVPKEGKRATSADITPQASRKAKSLLPKSTKPKQPDYTLECWLIQRKSAQALFVTFEFSEKESQSRGQWKLREMAKQFNGSCETDKLESNHDLVNWVLKDRKRKEQDSSFTWYPHAAKIERKGDALLGMGVEEQAMVIIRRQMTPSAQKVADVKAAAKAERAGKKDVAEKEAAKRKAAEAAFKKEKKEQAAKIKGLEKENAKLKMPRHVNVDANATDKPTKLGHTTVQPTTDKVVKDTSKAESRNQHLESNDKSTKPKEAATKVESNRSPKRPPKSENATKNLKSEAAVSSDEKRGAPTVVAETDAQDRNAAEKIKEKKEKPGLTSKGAIDTSAPKEEKGWTVAEIQALRDENAKLKAALQEEGSEV